MDYGTYSSASAGIAYLRRLEVVTNNLANVNTPGFKGEYLKQEQQPFEKTLASVSGDPIAKPDHDRYGGVSQFSTFTDFSLGSIRQTGNPLDVALKNPNDFFSVQTPQGARFTRAGNFTINGAGELTLQDGSQVLGDGGPITITGSSVKIHANGGIEVDGEVVGNLQVTRFSDLKNLKPEGSSRFKLDGAGGETVPAEVIPGSLEGSNVGVIPSVVELITVNRAFDMYTRTARNIDEMNQMSINQLGRGR